jgi:hypothetical protein
MCTKKSQGFRKFVVIYRDNGLINLWFMVNMQLLQPKKKSSNNVDFEIKSQILNMFQLH